MGVIAKTTCGACASLCQARAGCVRGVGYCITEGLVGVAERYLRKGSKVYIEGRLRTRKWQVRKQ